MLEDDYTGHPLEDFDDLLGPNDADLSEWDEDDFVDDLDESGETVVNIIDAVDGSKSLQDAAERLYEYADELLSLSALGWELMDDITNGQGIALMTWKCYDE
jgi:hypothetical protein